MKPLLLIAILTATIFGYKFWEIRNKNNYLTQMLMDLEPVLDLTNSYLPYIYSDMLKGKSLELQNNEVVFYDSLIKRFETEEDLIIRLENKIKRSLVLSEISKMVHICYKKTCGWNVIMYAENNVKYTKGDTLVYIASLLNQSCYLENNLEILDCSYKRYATINTGKIIYQLPPVFLDSILKDKNENELLFKFVLKDVITKGVDSSYASLKISRFITKEQMY